MASKQVTDRQKGAETVAAVVDAQGATLTESLSGVLGASGEELRSVLGKLGQALLGSRDAMVSADAAHESELADDPAARNERDGAASTLTGRLVELREVLTGLFGAELSRGVIDGKAPTDPVVLERFAGEVLDRLSRADLSSPRVPGAQLDGAALSANIGATRAALASKLEAVAREVREAQDTLAKKNQAVADYDRIFKGVALTLTGLFTLAGQDELARKVRPSARRPGQTLQEDEPEEEGGGA